MLTQDGPAAGECAAITAGLLARARRHRHTAGCASVSKVAYRSPGLPKGLQPSEVAALVDSCDRSQRAGLGDFAVLTLLSGVGLRAGEVANLQLDDIDWRSGELIVAGKGNRRDRLPLPIDVGQAIVDYLRQGRPSDALDRSMFIRVKAPHQGLTAGGVTQAVAAAARRAGLGTIYAHRLRHSAATSMLTAGASLAEIGQVLPPPSTADHVDLCQGQHQGAARPGPPLAGWGCVMSWLHDALTDYLALRRSLGFTLKRDEKLLAQFLSWLEQQGKHTITISDALAWVRLLDGASPSWLWMRMRAVRGFATYLHTLDPAVEIPPPGLIASHVRRAVPYLYSDADIAALLNQARTLRTVLRRATIGTLIGLLAVTGMRLGEVIALDEGDFDPANGLLVVRRAKFNTSRQIPLHTPTTAALLAYRRLRDRVFPHPVSEALLVSAAGTRGVAFQRRPDLREVGPTGRADAPVGVLSATTSRSAALLRRSHAAGVVSRRR
jgi:integrase